MNSLKPLIIIYLLYTHLLLGQDWASMTYSVNENDAEIFSGVFKSTSQEDIVLGIDCKDQKCIYQMTPREYIEVMKLFGWEITEQIQSKEKKGFNVVWFRRYQ